MNKNAQCYYESALKLLLPAIDTPEVDGFKVKLGKKNYFFCGFATPVNNSTSMYVARNKYCTNKMLESAGFPVPKAVVISCNGSEEPSLAEQIEHLNFPLVAKPQAGSLGQNVLCNIQNIEQLHEYINNNRVIYDYVTVEEYHGNLNSYRVLIFNDQVIGLIQRYPAQVVGDGIHDIEQLIDLTNARRLQINDTLGPIIADEECQMRLDEKGIDLGYVARKDEVLTLAYTCNATRGGTYRSLEKDIICKENSQLLIAAARELNLKLVGFDIQCADIQKPMLTSNGVIIEANDGPSIRIHEKPIEGRPVRVSLKVIRCIIYKHPLSYLYTLYKNRRSAPYIRSILLAAFWGVICCSLKIY